MIKSGSNCQIQLLTNKWITNLKFYCYFISFFLFLYVSSIAQETSQDDVNASIFNSTIDVDEIQLPLMAEPEEESESGDPESPWFFEDKSFDAFDRQVVDTIIKTDDTKYLLGVFPYGPNNQMRGFRDTILALKTQF